MTTLKERMASLRELRRFHNISLDQLAEEMGLSRSTLSRYERGYGKPDYIQREKIREAIKRLTENND